MRRVALALTLFLLCFALALAAAPAPAVSAPAPTQPVAAPPAWLEPQFTCPTSIVQRCDMSCVRRGCAGGGVDAHCACTCFCP
jgi:hypothetical protein